MFSCGASEWGHRSDATSTLNTFFSKSTYRIFDTKIYLESERHWLSILLKTFFVKSPFSSLN
jgi:hypothetical protein